MKFEALAACIAAAPCLITQLSTALIIGMLLFLVASGLTLIFGVLNVINFAHGSFYMLGAYFAFTAYGLTGSYALAFVAGAGGVALFGIVFERLFFSRVYGSDVLMQLLVCYAFILILDDVVAIVWGAEYQSMGMPATFALPPIRFAGGFIPPYYLFLVGVAFATALVLWLVIQRTRYGKIIRAAAINPGMVSSLGINTSLLYTGVFAVGSMLAGAAGALAAPMRSLTPGMGFSILIESFIITVIGGMGSIVGALVASVLIGLTRAFGTIGMPLFVDGLMFLMMVIVLITRPSGLFGKPVH